MRESPDAGRWSFGCAVICRATTPMTCSPGAICSDCRCPSSTLPDLFDLELGNLLIAELGVDEGIQRLRRAHSIQLINLRRIDAERLRAACNLGPGFRWLFSRILRWSGHDSRRVVLRERGHLRDHAGKIYEYRVHRDQEAIAYRGRQPATAPSTRKSSPAQTLRMALRHGPLKI